MNTKEEIRETIKGLLFYLDYGQQGTIALSDENDLELTLHLDESIGGSMNVLNFGIEARVGIYTQIYTPQKLFQKGYPAPSDYCELFEGGINIIESMVKAICDDFVLYGAPSY